MRIIIDKLLFTIVFVVILVFIAYQYYSLAEELYSSELNRSGKGYVSDEVWYVNSARNILLKVFNVKPRIYDNLYGVSIVYNNTLINASYIESVIIENKLNISIVDKRYSKINAIYLESSNPDELVKLINILKNTSGVLDTVWGWRIGDARKINEYFNLEHPPLFKYLICLSMYLVSDNPFNWRIPSIVAGLLTVFFIFLASFKLTGNKWLSLVVTLFTGLDPIMRIMSSIGLIDIYVALFTSITMYLVFSKKYRLALLISIIGSLFKFTSLFLLIPVLIIIIREKLRKEPSIVTLTMNTLIYSLLSLLIFIIIQIIVSIPLINYFGFNKWFYLSFINALKWHTSSKCTGPGCPVSSSPWDWFIGNNVFTIYYFSKENSLSATGFWPLWLISLIYSILFIPIYRFDRRFRLILLFFITQFFGYILLYVIGNRTQYSFYSVHFTPIVYLNLIYSFTYIVFDFNKLRKVFIHWRELFNKIWSTLLWILILK
uniref:Glycosyl transferase n=1 Tax=Staphylothermus marinus TaxID=2280 RepID=A0A7C4D816_STAMA